MNCLSLFLGYHGLPLLWSWMMDIGSSDSEEDKLLKRQVNCTSMTIDKLPAIGIMKT